MEKNQTMKVIQQIPLPTVNRGIQTFIISVNKKGFFAHELGDLTQFAEVFKKQDRIAHRLNKQVRFGNQHIKSRKPKPFGSIEEAITAIREQANTTIIYC
jgi:hypothetical protein